MSPENSKPIAPKEALELKGKLIPDEAIDSFNELIASNFSHGRSGFSEEEVLVLMERKGLKRDDILRNGWLRVTEIYQKAGWNVRRSGGSEEDIEPYYHFSEYVPSWD